MHLCRKETYPGLFQKESVKHLLTFTDSDFLLSDSMGSSATSRDVDSRAGEVIKYRILEV